MRRLADEDPLTGVLNRRSFEAAVRLVLELGAHESISGSLLMIDLDGFKAINDAHGHATGDAVLPRVGGDEFAVLLRETTGSRAQRVADALAARVRETQRKARHDVD